MDDAKSLTCKQCVLFVYFRVALLQLAVWDRVFLLDIPVLLHGLSEDDWRLLATQFLNKESILKLGKCQIKLVSSMSNTLTTKGSPLEFFPDLNTSSMQILKYIIKKVRLLEARQIRTNHCVEPKSVLLITKAYEAKPTF